MCRDSKLVRPEFNGNLSCSGDEDDLQKLIQLLDDPAKCEVSRQKYRQVINFETIKCPHARDRPSVDAADLY